MSTSTLFAVTLIFAGACGDAPALDGLETLVESTVEAAGDECEAGGIRLDFGRDNDRNGMLDASEITSTEYVCNGTGGAPGPEGVDGLQSLVVSVDIAPGAECAFGGVRIDFGIDSDSDGVLGQEEIDGSELLCNQSCPNPLIVVIKDFRDFSTGNLTSITDAELTVTATPAEVGVLNLNGIGVVGGASDTEVDAGESLLFTFSSPVINVSYIVGSARNTGIGSTLGDRNIEAFGPNGLSYGVALHTGVGESLLTVPDSSAPVESFVDSVTDDAHRIRSVTYSICR